MARWEKAAAPQARIQGLVGSTFFCDQDHKGGKILVIAPQAVIDPRADTGAARELRPGLEKSDGRVVIDGLGLHRPDDAEVVHDFRGVREQLAHPGAGLAVLLELEKGTGQRQGGLIPGHARETLAHPHRFRKLLAIAPVEQRLVIKSFKLRRPAAHKKVNDPFGPGREMGRSKRATFSEQVCDGDPAEPEADAVENLPSAELVTGYSFPSFHHRFITNSSWFMRVPARTAVAATSAAGSFVLGGCSPVARYFPADSGWAVKYVS